MTQELEKIKLRDYIKTLNIGPVELDGQAMCANKWTHTYVYLGANIVKNCFNVPNRIVTEEEMEKYGKDVFFNHPYEIARRQEKLDNIKHIDCANCWECESRGMISSRLPNNFYEFHRQRLGVEKGTDPLPTNLEVYFTNTCDLKCVYCSPQYSSQWEAELTKYGDPFVLRKEKNNQKFKDLFYQWLEEDAVTSILKYFVLGGEPLIQNEFYEFTDRLYKLLKEKATKHNIKPVLIVVTNGNTPEKYLNKWFEQIEKLQDLISIQLDISMESTGDRAEFIRSNLEWSRFESNVKRILEFSKHKDVQIRFSCTHTALNLPTFNNFLMWTQYLGDYEFDFTRSSVVNPPELAPWMLTEEFAKDIDMSIEWFKKHRPDLEDYQNFLHTIKNSFGKHTDEQLANVPNFIEKIVERRGKDFVSTFPELQSWYNKCLQLREFYDAS